MSNESLAETIETLTDLIGGAASREGYELIDLEYKRAGRGYILRVIIDRAGRTSYKTEEKASSAPKDGVGIGDCATFSRLIGPALDVEDVIPAAYTLEVSSPGVNRPLKSADHFSRAIGLRVRVKTRTPVNGESFFIAELSAADDEGIQLDHQGVERRIPYRLIERANVEFDFQ